MKGESGGKWVTVILLVTALMTVCGGTVMWSLGLPAQVADDATTAGHVLTQDDLDAGGVTNQATAMGVAADGTDVSSTPATATVKIIVPTPEPPAPAKTQAPVEDHTPEPTPQPMIRQTGDAVTLLAVPATVGALVAIPAIVTGRKHRK